MSIRQRSIDWPLPKSGYNEFPALRFKNGYVDKEDVQTLLDELFFQRAVQTYLWLFA
jgi:hypothetical protein